MIMGKSVDYYISKGLDERTAKYFASGRRVIVGVVPSKDLTLTLSFDNGETRRYDVRPLIQKGSVFEPLFKWDNFCRVYLDDDHCVAWDIDPNVDSRKVWSNKIDLCSDSCYMDSSPVSKEKAIAD